MQQHPIGPSDLKATRLIYGCMRTVGTWNPAEITPERKAGAFAALDAARDAEYTHFDHADIYCNGGCESVFGEWLKSRGIDDASLVITTKCGIRWAGDPTPDAPHRFDFSKGHILRSCEQSLKRLGIETIDIYLLHRPDALMNPPEIAEAFAQLKQQGKVRYFGVSNFTVPQFEHLQAAVKEPLVCNQIEVHPGRLSPIEDGTLDTLHRLGVTPTAWSPVAGGRFGDGPLSEDVNTRRIQDVLDAEAKAHGVSRTVMTLAWLLKHPSGIQPIIGTVKPERIKDAVAADTLELSREAWYRIYLAARGKPLP